MQKDEHKTIEINPHLLAHTLKNAGKKRTKKNHNDDEDFDEDMEERRKPRIQMNERLKQGSRTHRYERKSLLREYRKKQEELLNEGGGDRLIVKDGGIKIDTSSSFSKNDDFMDSVNFIKHLEEDMLESSKPILIPPTKSNTILPTPDYGCMKNGTSPTFRQWSGQQPGIQRKTQRMNVRYSPNVYGNSGGDGGGSRNYQLETEQPHQMPNYQVPQSQPTYYQEPVLSQSAYIPELSPPSREPSFFPPILTAMEKESRERAREINEQLRLQQMMREREEEDNKHEEKMGGNLGKRKKTIRRKLHTGKINDRVSILIPNKTIRNRFHNSTQKLHQTSIQEIRKFLLKRGFIKVGSSAPTEILRKMYEDLHMLGGEVQNMNGENIVYNFKAKGGEEL
jgi:hypothetical protein